MVLYMGEVGAMLNILYVRSPFPIGILYIGGCVIIVPLLLLCVFRMILNKEKSTGLFGHVP